MPRCAPRLPCNRTSSNMTSFVSILALGFFLGMRHATDPDHVIAVTTIVSRQKTVKYGALIGAVWGFGHTLTILLVGSGIILFNVVIPPRLGLAMEVSVGVMLILLGVLNISGMMPAGSGALERMAFAQAPHPHSHFHSLDSGTQQHDARIDDHAAPENSSSATDGANSFVATTGVGRIIRPLVVGIVHGLAGSAAVALLVLTTIRSPYGAVAYLLVFGAGTIAGMMLITAAIAVPFAFSDARFRGLNRTFGMVSAVASVCFGLFVVYQTGFMGGLFARNPVWTPR